MSSQPATQERCLCPRCGGSNLAPMTGGMFHCYFCDDIIAAIRPLNPTAFEGAGDPVDEETAARMEERLRAISRAIYGKGLPADETVHAELTIYLASRYSRRNELLGYARDLMERCRPVRITSRWLQGNHQIDDQGLSAEATREERERFAREDWEDVAAADWMISFTEPPRSTSSRGGRHVELGIALGTNKRCIVVGPRENVFHALPGVEVFVDWAACLSMLVAERSVDPGWVRAHWRAAVMA